MLSSTVNLSCFSFDRGYNFPVNFVATVFVKNFSSKKSNFSVRYQCDEVIMHAFQHHETTHHETARHSLPFLSGRHARLV